MQTEKITPDLISEIKTFLSRDGATVAEASRRFGFSSTAINYRLRLRRPRSAFDEFDDHIPEVEHAIPRRIALAPPLGGWHWPDPASEAKFLLGIANRNGGVNRMRDLINVSPSQEAALWRLVDDGQLPRKRVADALKFRAEVLRVFDAITVQDGVRREKSTTVGRALTVLLFLLASVAFSSSAQLPDAPAPTAPITRPAWYKPDNGFLTRLHLASAIYDGVTTGWTVAEHYEHEVDPVARFFIGRKANDARMVLFGGLEVYVAAICPGRHRRPVQVTLIAAHFAAGTHN